MCIKNVVLVGASGHLGSRVLDHLVKLGRHDITVITRPESTATFPDSVHVQRGRYHDATFLAKAFAGNDIVILMLSFAAIAEEGLLFDAAAKAGVKYIVPSEWGAPVLGDHTAGSGLMASKLANHRRIEELGMKWIMIATNSWLDYSLIYGLWDIDIPARKATIYTDSGTFNTATVPYIGAAMAKFLSLPAATIDRDYANNCLYLSSFTLTQPQIFEAVLRATDTNESDWEIERTSIQRRIERGRNRVAEGDAGGYFDILYGATIENGDYSAHINSQNLHIPREDLDEVVREAVGKAVAGPWKGAEGLFLNRKE